MVQPNMAENPAPNPEEGSWLYGREICSAQTVLFVEDEGFVRGVAGEVLRTAGYQVLIAADASEATRKYETQLGAVDLLLTDVVLPGESGPTLAARLRRANPRLKVLLITGYGEQMVKHVAGSEECLAKPFSVDALLRRVRQVLDGGEPSHKETGSSFKPACGIA